MRKIIIAEIVAIMMTTCLCGCGTTVIPIPDDFKTVQAKSEKKAVEDDIADPVIWVEMSGSGIPFASGGDYPKLCVTACHAAGARAKVEISDSNGKWREVSQEVMEASIGDVSNYHISSSIIELLAAGKQTIDMNTLNVMLLDLDPNLTKSVTEYGKYLNTQLHENPGSAVSMRTVLCSYNGTLSISLENNNGTRTENIEGLTKRNLVVLAIGPEQKVFSYMKKFDDGTAKENLNVTSQYTTSTNAYSVGGKVKFRSKGFVNDTKNNSLLDKVNKSYNIIPVTASDHEELKKISQDEVQVLQYTGECMDEGWIDRLYVTKATDSLKSPFRIKDISVKKYTDKGKWKSIDSEFLGATIRVIGINKKNRRIYCLSFGEKEKQLSGIYAITLKIHDVESDHNDSVSNASASTAEYLDALNNGRNKEIFQKLMSFNQFCEITGDGLYRPSEQICSTIRVLVTKR